nr:thiamine pyrophosphokinase [Caenorhabditis elegans]|eukprot:NP_001023023.1 Thiamin pyrophosphokinase 1 [Caenorhabditis elegans]
MSKKLKPFEILEDSCASVCIWLNGEPTAISNRAENLWNKAKYRVATDGAVNEILKRKSFVEWPHIICGDFDSINKQIDTKNAKVVHLPDQDYTDLSKSVQWCLEQKTLTSWEFENIVVLGGLNGRFDHTMSTLSSLIRFVDSQTPGDSNLDVNLEMTTKMCGIIPIVQKETIVSSIGLKYEMENLALEFGKLISTSNEVTTSQVFLKSSSSLIFSIELENWVYKLDSL